MQHNELKELDNLKKGMLCVGERSLAFFARLHTWQGCISPQVLIAVASVIPKFYAIGGLEVRLC
jgi:hypothetical protein